MFDCIFTFIGVNHALLHFIDQTCIIVCLLYIEKQPICNDVTCSFRVATVEGLKQYYVLMPADIKDAYLVQILDKYTETNKKSSIMIFTNTCK